MTEFVYKYPVEATALAAGKGAFAVELPSGARIVLAGFQYGRLTLWAIGDPDLEYERREFLLRGTGHALPTNVRHVYSFMQNEGEFVWHLFEPVSPEEGSDG